MDRQKWDIPEFKCYHLRGYQFIIESRILHLYSSKSRTYCSSSLDDRIMPAGIHFGDKASEPCANAKGSRRTAIRDGQTFSSKRNLPESLGINESTGISL